MAQVSVKNLSSAAPKAGEVAAVGEVSFEIGDGEFATMVGPAHSGKTTILRLIAGLDEAAGGEIFIGDRKVSDLPPKDREIAMVFRSYALYPHLSAYENVAFGLRIRKFAASEIKKRVQEAAAILEIENVLEHKPATLNAEQKLRVALGRALVRQPKVFLFEEPFALLDAMARERMRTEIARLHQRLETAMILTTQDPAEAMSLSDRLIALGNGTVQQSGGPSAIYAAPANMWVAGFLGNPPMNLIGGALKQERDLLVFREKDEGTLEFRFPASAHPGVAEFVGKSIVLGVRPEALELTEATTSKQDARPIFPALLEVVQSTGAESILHLQTGAHALVSRSRVAIDRHEAGRRVRCTFSPESVHFFDPDSKERIG